MVRLPLFFPTGDDDGDDDNDKDDGDGDDDNGALCSLVAWE